MLPARLQKSKVFQNRTELKNKPQKTIIFPNPKFILFPSRFFCQYTSVHLQKAKAFPIAYFAKELIPQQNNTTNSLLIK